MGVHILATDCISRQEAIDALKEHRALYCDNTPVSFSKLSYAEKSRVDELDTAIATIVNLPSAEPKRGKWIDAVIPNDNGDLFVQVCDQCNTFFPLAYTGGGHHFCPNCGADMRGDTE